MVDFRRALQTQVLVGDGAMGTELQNAGVSEECNELLNVTAPDVITAVHNSYLAAGADLLTTNTFGANTTNLADYGLEERVEELARAGAEIARRCADTASTAAQPRYVMGSMGPGTKLPSLGQITYAELKASAILQARGLLAGGVDAVVIETSQDPLAVRALVAGARAAMAEAGREVPVLASVTVEESGTMLLGTTIEAALVTLTALGIDAIGLNCATGPDLMREPLKYLSEYSPIPVMCVPNAGLPELTGGVVHYPLTPAELAEWHATFVRDLGLSLVGGCCGTTPAHIEAVAGVLRGIAPTPRATRSLPPSLSSLYGAETIRQEASYLAIGERANANGSKAFRELMQDGRWEDLLDLARTQEEKGAHLLDICVDFVGRDSVADMREAVSRLATSAKAPLVIDSTNADVIRAGLELAPGRSVVNSVSLEDPTRLPSIMAAAKEHGAAVVALTIDQDGQARSEEHKVDIAEQLLEILATDWGLAPSDVIVDCLTFPIATGQEETRRDGIATIEAIRELKRRHPSVGTVLGVSNVSFGLTPPARRVLNTVFLHEARHAGLDAAIVNPVGILPRSAITDAQWQAAEDLIWDRRTFDETGELTHDPLAHLLDVFTDGAPAGASADPAASAATQTPAERVHARIVTGNRTGLDDDLAALLDSGVTGQAVLNEVLLPAMAEVGELFGSGHMQLPFVLQSAETMRAATEYLRPHLGAADGASANGEGATARGTMVLATVRGDVHDIGKNLVDIILTGNGYRVINLGIKVPIGQIIDAALAHDADVIGLSGLLVKSAEVMREYLAELTACGLAERWPVILGGAALNKRYVEQDLQAEFPGIVRYAKDAFSGLKLMDELCG